MMKKRNKIGLLGEDPHDTQSIINLLSPKYPHLSFKSITRKATGDSLLSNATLRIVAKEDPQEFALLILVKDSDKSEEDCDQLKTELVEFLKKIEKKYPVPNILLLNIRMLEALILADIDSFNKLYQSKISFKGNPMSNSHPKNFLMEKTYGAKANRKYEESHAPDIFSALNFDLLKKNCRYFKDFIEEFDTNLKKLKN